MSGKLDKSLDDIVMTTKKANRGGRVGRGGRPVRAAGRKVTAPVVGGIAKNTRNVRTNGKPAVPTVALSGGTSKILVTGLPQDVSEQQIKEYFQQTIGPIASVVVTYGANGQSRGIAAITFRSSNSAAMAAEKLDGTKVDGKPMKIEVIISAKQAPAPKTLGDRMTQQPKAVAGKAKPKAVTQQTPARRGGATKKAGRGGRAGRGKPKTSDELDAEMTDYFGPKDGAATNGTTTNGAPAGADASMDDQIM